MNLEVHSVPNQFHFLQLLQLLQLLQATSTSTKYYEHPFELFQRLWRCGHQHLLAHLGRQAARRRRPEVKRSHLCLRHAPEAPAMVNHMRVFIPHGRHRRSLHPRHSRSHGCRNHCRPAAARPQASCLPLRRHRRRRHGSRMRPECVDSELTREFSRAGPREDGGWHYETEIDGVVTAVNVSTLSTRVEPGRVIRFTYEQHVQHCIFEWRKQHRAAFLGTTLSLRRNYEDHIKHCGKMLLMKAGMNETRTRLVYPSQIAG